MKRNRTISAVLIFTAVMAVMAQGTLAMPSHPVFGTFLNASVGFPITFKWSFIQSESAGSV